MKINWWEIGDNQYLHLSDKALFRIYKEIKNQYGSLNKFGKKLGITCGSIYPLIKHRKYSTTVQLYKKILKKLNIPLSTLNDQIKSIGTRKSINPKFPLEIVPEYGELLAHAFFDGYADFHIFRYSNYNYQLRNEFIELLKKLKLGKIKANIPKNYERDIDLPYFIPRLLSAIFDIPTFYSNQCGISKKFSEIVKKDNKFGWYFIKGAYLDDGTITGHQVFLARGITNYKFVKDISKLCHLIGLNAKIRLINKKINAYGVYVLEDSYPLLNEIFSSTTYVSCDKINKLLKKIEKLKEIRRKENNYKFDLQTIINKAKQREHIRVKDVMKFCNISEKQAHYRLYLLVHTGNLKLTRKKRKLIFTFKRSKLPKDIPKINDIRRLMGWR